MTTPALVSSPGTLGFSFLCASSFLRIMAKTSYKGSRAIHVSRFKTVVIDAVQEVEKERQSIIKSHAEMTKNEEGTEVIKDDGKGMVVFKTPANKVACQTEVEKLLDETPIMINIGSPSLRIAAKQLLGILTGDDCPEIPNGEDWFHNQIVNELELGLTDKP